MFLDLLTYMTLMYYENICKFSKLLLILHVKRVFLKGAAAGVRQRGENQYEKHYIQKNYIRGTLKEENNKL